MNDDFVDIQWSDKGGPPAAKFYDDWIKKASAPHSGPPVAMYDLLQGLYPDHSVVLNKAWNVDLLGFPGASVKPMEGNPLITNLLFIPLPARLGIPGMLVDMIESGSFEIKWNNFEFLLFVIKYPAGFNDDVQQFILHKGPEDPVRLLLLTAGDWGNRVRDEIWVFNQGFWRKDHGLWVEVQKASWKDVILKEEFKKALQKDVYGFFDSEKIYKELAIPWKRGLIMYGPPGNGKTISIKTIMKTCSDKGFLPLYVKSFQSWAGEEASMAAVFDKAREVSPCVIIIEDLDSLINDQNRSFFLNQLDGLEGNDGLLVIGTTNHFERLDPGLSTRPSRFDRKYLFDDPDFDERVLYVKYWQQKLASNDAIEFPDRLVTEVANLTALFSFAYLKESFVSSLVTLAGIEDDKPTFESVLKSQIKTLRKQLDKMPRESLTDLDDYSTSRSSLTAPSGWLDMARSHTSKVWRPRESGGTSRTGDSRASRVFSTGYTENAGRRATRYTPASSSDMGQFNDMLSRQTLQDQRHVASAAERSVQRSMRNGDTRTLWAQSEDRATISRGDYLF